MSGPVREPQGHRVWRFGADINTDVLAPGAYMKLGIEGIAPHCLETVRPEFAGSVQRGDVIVAGRNFGIGSSREQAAAALVQRRRAPQRRRSEPGRWRGKHQWQGWAERGPAATA